MAHIVNATERYEAVGELYRRATGYLRPGKSEKTIEDGETRE